MIKCLIWNNSANKQLMRTTQKRIEKFKQSVQKIIDKVKQEKDDALRFYAQAFDFNYLNTIQVNEDEMTSALMQVPLSTIQAFKEVIKKLSCFHQQQALPDYQIETSPGICCEQQSRPIQRVGLYVPAGSAPLVSTLLMLAIPSQIAGCPMRILCTPANKNNQIDVNLLVAASLCGIDKIYKVGGAQAIAAMAYGTETIPKVDKIFGPGNSWVTMAKMLVAVDPQGAQIDIPAGPSEVLIIADEWANPRFVAADLLSQAEHGADSQVLLLCLSQHFAIQVKKEIKKQLPHLTREKIIRESLKNSLIIIVDNLHQAIDVSNQYAPEHLILQVENPRQYLAKILSAGSVFLGPWSPESVGDYASGTNHVLPTCGFAKSCSGLSVRDFCKTLSIQELTRPGLASLANMIRVLSSIEGLDGHQKAIDIRIEEPS